MQGGADAGLEGGGNYEHSVTEQCTIRLWRSWEMLSPRAFSAFIAFPESFPHPQRFGFAARAVLNQRATRSGKFLPSGSGKAEA